MKNLVIVGAGDLSKEVVWLIEDINKRKPTYLILGFLDDDQAKIGTEYYGYKVLGNVDYLDELNKKMQFSAVVAMQDGEIRKKIVENHSNFKSWESIVHPTAVIANSSCYGKGSIFFPQVTVSVDSKLGDFGLYYIHSTVCNDCCVGDYVSLMSGASLSEHVMVGERCFLGAGACVYPHKSIGKKSKVSVGSVVDKDYGDEAKIGEKGTGFFLFK